MGKISEKEITYLMTRKLSRDQAVSLIIRGFMDVGILGLPDVLNARDKKNSGSLHRKHIASAWKTSKKTNESKVSSKDAPMFIVPF